MKINILLAVFGSVLMFSNVSCNRCDEETLVCQDLALYSPLVSGQASQSIDYKDQDGVVTSVEFASVASEGIESESCQRDGLRQCRCNPCRQYASVSGTYVTSTGSQHVWSVRVDVELEDNAPSGPDENFDLKIVLNGQPFYADVPLQDDPDLTFFPSITINGETITNVFSIPATNATGDLCYYHEVKGVMAVVSERLEYSLVRVED